MDEKDCKAKWEAAELWVTSNAGYKIQTQSSVVIQTYSGVGSTTTIAAKVVKQSLGGGKYRIVGNVWCDNIFTCDRDTKALLQDFNETVRAAIP